MSKYFKIFIIPLFLIFLIGCNNVKFEEYNGESLNIGVIGEIPNVREKIIKFNNIDFEDLLNESTLIKYDAIFITKENLSEAAKKEYAPIYNECVVPFFFIGSTKGYIPFIKEDLSYEYVPQLEDPPSYAVGIFKESDGLSFIGYGLYNDSENEKSIEDVYSRMFTSIAENREND